MSGHLRHCPRHRKPLPCAHCALAAKPAVMEPEEIPVVRPAHTVEVETSVGSLRVAVETDSEDSADRATEKAFEKMDEAERLGLNPKTTVRKGSVPEAPLSQRLPSYLKSVAHPVIPSADPEAPFGRDENDRPILPGRSDQQLASDLLNKEFLAAGVCPHKANPKYCLLCGTTNYTAAPAEPVDLEAQLRRLLGINDVVPHVERNGKKFDYFPEILGITRGQLIGLLDLPAGVSPRAVKKTVLKSKTAIVARLAALEKASIRIEELKQLIAASEDLIRSWSVHVQKLQVKRGERNPEDILDKKTREKFKREERIQIEKYELEKRDLQNFIRGSNAETMRQRVAKWGSSPDDFETVTTVEDVPVKFGEKFTFSDKHKTIDGYVALLDEYDMLKDASRRLQKFSTLDQWRYFENEIVLQAVGYRLVRLTKHTFKEYPQLTEYLNGPPVDDEPEQDETENKLILKTKGAQIGGGIYGSNAKGATRIKTFEKYDKNRRRGNQDSAASDEYGGGKPDNWFGDLDSGDLDERVGDE